MHHAGIQYGQAPMSATAHPQFNNVAELSVPSAAPSTTTSLRQWRKKEGGVAAVPEIKAPSLQSEPSGENQGPIARVAPHAHYPRPSEPYRYPQQQAPPPYENYGLGYKEPAPVKYSEIVEPVQPPHRIEHAPPLQVQKPKEKEYLEMCSMQQQMKHGYAMLPQYNMQKESQMYIPNYHLPNCKIPPNYHQRQYGNDGFHLALYERQEQQIYMEQQRVAYQNQRMYRPQFHPNYRAQYNYPNYKPNIQSDPYRMHPYQQMQNYKIAPHLDAVRNLSPRRVYHETYPRVSPNYNQCSQLEYAQHYQNRRQIPTDYLPHQQMQNHQMPDLVTDATPKSSLKQFLETWNDDIPEIQDGSKKDDNLYILDSTEIPTESIQQFIHLQVDKLPENIKGFIGPSTSSQAQGVIRENEVLNLTQDTVIRSQQPSVISETKKFLEVESQKIGNAALDLLQSTVIVYNENSEKNESVIRENFKKSETEVIPAKQLEATTVVHSPTATKCKTMPSLEATTPKSTNVTETPVPSLSSAIVATKYCPKSTTPSSEAETTTTVLRETTRVEDMPSKCPDMPSIEDPSEIDNVAGDSEMQFSNVPLKDESLTGKDDRENSRGRENPPDDRGKFLNEKGDTIQEDTSDKILDYTREKLLSDTREKLLEYSPDIPENFSEKSSKETNKKIMTDGREKVIEESKIIKDVTEKITGDPKEIIIGDAKEKCIEDGKDKEATKDKFIEERNKTREILLEDENRKLNSERQLPDNNIPLTEIKKEKSNLVVEEVIDASPNKITTENKIQASSIKVDVKLPEAHTIIALKPEVEGDEASKVKNSQPVKEIPRNATEKVEQNCNTTQKIEDNHFSYNDSIDAEIKTVKRRTSSTSVKATDASSTNSSEESTETSDDDNCDSTSSDEHSCCASPATDSYNSTHSTSKQQASRKSVTPEKAEKDVKSCVFPKSSSVTSSAIEIANTSQKTTSNLIDSATSDFSSKPRDSQNSSAAAINSLPKRNSIITEAVSSNGCKSTQSCSQTETFCSESSNKSKLSKSETLPIVPSNSFTPTESPENLQEENKNRIEDNTAHLEDNSENNNAENSEESRKLCEELKNKDTLREQLENNREKFLEDTRKKYLENTRKQFLEGACKERLPENSKVKILDDTEGDTREKFEKHPKEPFKEEEVLRENASGNQEDTKRTDVRNNLDYSRRNLLEDAEKDLLEESTRAFNSEREELLKESKRVRFVPEEIPRFSCEEREENVESSSTSERSKDLSGKPEEAEKEINKKSKAEKEIVEDNEFVSFEEKDRKEMGEAPKEILEDNTNKLRAQEAEDKQSKRIIKDATQIDTFEERASEVHALNLTTKNLRSLEENQNIETRNNLKSIQQENKSEFFVESSQNQEAQVPNTSEFDGLKGKTDSVIVKQVEETPKTDMNEEGNQLVTFTRETDETTETNEENITCTNALAVDENYVLLQIGGEILEINVINTMGRKIISVVPFTDCTVVTENNNEAGIVNLEGEELQEVLFVEEENLNKENGVNEMNSKQIENLGSKTEENSNFVEDIAGARKTILEEENKICNKAKCEEIALNTATSIEYDDSCKLDNQDVELKNQAKSKQQDDEEESVIIIDDDSSSLKEENVILEETIMLGGENVLLQEEHVISQEGNVILEEEENGDNIILGDQNEETCEEGKTKNSNTRHNTRSLEDNIEEALSNVDKNQTIEQATRLEEEDYKIVESEDNKIVLKRRRKSTPKALAWEEDRKARIARNIRIAKKEVECENIKTRSKTLKENKKLNTTEEDSQEISDEIIEEVNEEIIECDVINEIEIEAPSTPKSDIPILSPPCLPLINSPLINSPLINPSLMNSALINSPIINAPLFNPLLSLQTLNPPKLDKELLVVLKPEDEISNLPSSSENEEVESSPPPVKLDKRLVVMLKPEDEVKVAKHIRKLKAAKRPLRRIQSYKDYIKSKEKKEAKRQDDEESSYSKTKRNFSIISRDRRMKVKTPSSRNKKSPFEEEKKVTFKETKDIIEIKECKESVKECKVVKEVKRSKVSKAKPKVRTKAELKDTSPAKAPLKSILKKSKVEEPDSPKKKLSLEEYINRKGAGDKEDGKSDIGAENIDKSKIEKIASKLDKIRILQGRKEEKKARSDEEDSIIKALRKMEEESSGNIFEDVIEAQIKQAEVESDGPVVPKTDKTEVKLDRFDRIEVKTDRFEAKSDRFEPKTDIFDVNSAFTAPLKQYQKKKPVETTAHKCSEMKPHYGDITPHYSDVTPLYNEITPCTPQYNEGRYAESLSHYNIVSPHYIEMTHYSYKDPRCFKEGYCNKDPRKKDNYCQELYSENHYPNMTYNTEIMPPQYSAQYNEVISPYSEVTSPYSEALPQVAPQYNVHHYNESVNYNTMMPQYNSEYREVTPHYNDTNYSYSEAVPINSENNYKELKSYYTKATPHYNSENKHQYHKEDRKNSEELASHCKSPMKERRTTRVTSKYSDPRISDGVPRRNSESKLSNRENYRTTTSKQEAVSEVLPNNKRREDTSKQNLETTSSQKLEAKQELESKQGHADKQSREDKQKLRPEKSQSKEDQIVLKNELMEGTHKPDKEKFKVIQNIEVCKENLKPSKERLEASAQSVPSIEVIASCNTEASSRVHVEASVVPELPTKETYISEACRKQKVVEETEATKQELVSKSNDETSIQETASDPRNQEAKTKQKTIGEESIQDSGRKKSSNEIPPARSLKHQYLNSLGLRRDVSPSPPLLEPETNSTAPNKNKIEDAPPVLRKEVLDFGLEEDEEELDFEEDISSSWPSPSPSKVCEAFNKECGTSAKNASSKTCASIKDGDVSAKNCEASNKICGASTKNCDLSIKDCDACTKDCDASTKNGDVSGNDCQVETLVNKVQVQGPLDARNGSLRMNASSTTKSVFNEQKQIISDLNKKIDDIFMLTFRTSNYEDDLLKRFTNGERMAPGELLKVRNVIQRKNFKIQKPKAKDIINLEEISYRKTNVIDLNDFNLDVPVNKPKVKSIIDLNELLPAKLECKVKQKSYSEESRVPTQGLKVLGQPRYTTKIYRLSEDVTTIPKKPKMPTLLPLTRKGRYDFDTNESRHQSEVTNRRKYKRDPRNWKNYQKDDKKDLVKTTRNKSHIPIHPVWSRLQLSEEDGKGRNNHNKSHNNQERSAKYYEENYEDAYTKEIIRERRTKEEHKLQENAKESKCQGTPRIEDSARGRKDPTKVHNENVEKAIANVPHENIQGCDGKNQENIQISEELGDEDIQSPEESTKDAEFVQISEENSKGCQENVQKSIETTINNPKTQHAECEIIEVCEESNKNHQEHIQQGKESTKECHIKDSTNRNQRNIKANNIEESTKETGEEINWEDIKITTDKEETVESKDKVEGNLQENESLPLEVARKVENVVDLEESPTNNKIENLEEIRTEITSEEIKTDLAETIQGQAKIEPRRIGESKEESITSEEGSEDICVKRQKLSHFEDNQNKLEETDIENLIVAESKDTFEETCSEEQVTLPDCNENKLKDTYRFEESMGDEKLEDKMTEDRLEDTVVEDKLEERMTEDEIEVGIIEDKVEEETVEDKVEEETVEDKVEEETVEDKLEKIHENKLEEMGVDNLAEMYEDKLEEIQEDRECVETKKLNVLQNYVLKPKSVNLNVSEETNHNSMEYQVGQHNQVEVVEKQENNSVYQMSKEETLNMEDSENTFLNTENNLNGAEILNPEENNCNPVEENTEHSIINEDLNVSADLVEETTYKNHSFYKDNDETKIDSLQKENKQQEEINCENSLHKKEDTEMRHSLPAEKANPNSDGQNETEIQHSSYLEDEHSIQITQGSKGHSVLWTNPKRERRSITVLKMMRRKQDADAEEILDITTPDEIQNELNFSQEQIPSNQTLNSPRPYESTSHHDSNYINFTSTEAILNSKSEESGHYDSKLNYINFTKKETLNSKSVHQEESTSQHDSTLNYTNFTTKKQQISRAHRSRPISNSYLDSQPEESVNVCAPNLGYLDLQPESPKILNLSTKCDPSNRRESIIISNKTKNSIDESLLPINLCCNASKNVSRDEMKLKQELNVNVLNLKRDEAKLKHEESYLKCDESNLKQHVVTTSLKQEESKLIQEMPNLKREESNSEPSCLKLNVAHDESLATRNDLDLILQRQSNFAGNEDSSPISNGCVNFSPLNELNRRSQMSLLSQTRCESNRNLYYKKYDLNFHTSINRRPYLETLKTESARRRRDSKNYKSKIRVNMMNNENNNSFRARSDELINNSNSKNANGDSELKFLESCKATCRYNTVIQYDSNQQNSISGNINMKESNTSINESNNINIIKEPESNRSAESYINTTGEESTANISHAYFKFGNSIELNSNIFCANNLALNNTTLTPIPKDSQNLATIPKPTRRRKSIFDSIQILSTGEPSSVDIVNRFDESTARVVSAVNIAKSCDDSTIAIELSKRVGEAINGTKQESSGGIEITKTGFESRAQKVSEESIAFRSIPILPAEVPSSVDIIESTARVNSVYKICEELNIDIVPKDGVNIVDAAVTNAESTETIPKVTDRISHESSGTKCDSDLLEAKFQNKISCDPQEKSVQNDLQRNYDDLQEKGYDLQPSEEKKTLLSPSVFNEDLSICENVEVTSCDLKPRQLRKIPELVAIDKAKFMNPLRRVRKVHSALPVPSEEKRVRFEEPAKKKSIDDISRKLMDICKDNIGKPEYESVSPSDDLKLHLKKVKKSRKRKRFRNLHAASSDEEADYSVFESKNPKGLPKLIIKRNVVEVREHFQPIVRIERDPKLDSMAKRKRKC